jgi:hypothetical protein
MIGVYYDESERVGLAFELELVRLSRNAENKAGFNRHFNSLAEDDRAPSRPLVAMF